jgi:hypothetical protein
VVADLIAKAANNVGAKESSNKPEATGFEIAVGLYPKAGGFYVLGCRQRLLSGCDRLSRDNVNGINRTGEFLVFRSTRYARLSFSLDTTFVRRTKS